VAPIFTSENAYDALIAGPAKQYGVPASLVKALIAHESQFQPQAARFEGFDPSTTADDDSSRGLMQLLYKTARDELGYKGSPDGLFDPAVNIPLGIRYLALQRQRANGGWEEALSAYNGGYRPTLGFGRRATEVLRVCLRRDAQGNCLQRRNVPVGEFSNQPYVDAVMRYWAHFKESDPAPAPAPPPAAIPQADGAGCGIVLFVLASSALWGMIA
jgi:hypothetical protein